MSICVLLLSCVHSCVLRTKSLQIFMFQFLVKEAAKLDFDLTLTTLSEDILIYFYNYFYRQIISPKRNIQRNLRGYGHYFRRNGWILREPKRSNHSRPSSVSFISLSKLNPKVQSYNPPSYQPYKAQLNQTSPEIYTHLDKFTIIF